MSARARRLAHRPLLLLLGTLLVGCPRPPRPAPELQGVAPAQLLDALQHDGAQRQQAVGLVQLDYAAVDGFFKGQADVAVARPARLRVELRSFFGQPAGALASDGERYAFVDNLAARARQGQVGDAALTALLPLGLPLDATVPLLLGALPPLQPGETRYVAPEHGALALQHRAARGDWVLELDAEGRRLLRVALRDRGAEEIFAVEFAAHRPRAGLSFPDRGAVRVRGRAGSVSWRWEEVELNGEALPEEAWQLQIPPGYSVADELH